MDFGDSACAGGERKLMVCAGVVGRQSGTQWPKRCREDRWLRQVVLLHMFFLECIKRQHQSREQKLRVAPIIVDGFGAE